MPKLLRTYFCLGNIIKYPPKVSWHINSPPKFSDNYILPHNVSIDIILPLKP